MPINNNHHHIYQSSVLTDQKVQLKGLHSIIDTHLGDLKKHHTQDGLGGGTKLGVMTDHISSSANT